jgi:bacterial/archaeal transporter family-2 protein
VLKPVAMSRVVALLCTLIVGGLVALQPPANAALAGRVGDIAAAFVSLTISVLIVGVLLVIAGDPGRLSGLRHFRPEYVLGGVAGAAIVTVSLVTVRSLGAGGVTAALVTAQLIVSVIADRVGILGLRQVGIGWQRLAGVALVIAGTYFVTRRW